MQELASLRWQICAPVQQQERAVVGAQQELCACADCLAQLALTAQPHAAEATPCQGIAMAASQTKVRAARC
jgi:hypothetical protein